MYNPCFTGCSNVPSFLILICPLSLIFTGNPLESLRDLCSRVPRPFIAEISSTVRITNQPQKAYTLLGDLYDSSKNLDYLAQQAIIQFEMAEDKTKVVNDVIAKLERVSITNNPIFENYLAYIYIDYNINLKRGVFLVKKALEQDPKNIAFLDTLAWGEYKLKNCKEAFKQMKKVIDEVGLDDAEIKMHWHKIKECKK